MADVQFGHSLQSSDVADVQIVETVPGMQFQTTGHRDPPRIHQSGEFTRVLGIGCGIRIAARMQLDRLGSQLSGELDLGRIGVDEQADLQPGVQAPFDGFGNAIAMTDNIKAPLGCQFGASFWNEGDLVRTRLDRNRDDGGVDRKLEVKSNVNGLSEQAKITVLNVPTILPKMDRDSIRAGKLGKGGRPDRIRFLTPASLAKGRDMIDVDTQAWHCGESLPQLGPFSF